jgi:hypothetical protein
MSYLILIGVILVAITSYYAGYLVGKTNEIEKQNKQYEVFKKKIERKW